MIESLKNYAEHADEQRLQSFAALYTDTETPQSFKAPPERQLVTVRTVDDVEPILNADAIEVATLGGWSVVVKKGEVAPGDRVFYFEIDSFLPDGNPAWQFLVDKQPRTFEGRLGHRLRTVKLRGQVSQGFVVPWCVLPELAVKVETDEGLDLAGELGVVKWEAPAPAEFVGQPKGTFPGWIRKTDQGRCQNLVSEIFQYEDLVTPWGTKKAKAAREARYEVSLKLDGSSCTVFARGSAEAVESGVCSRNMQLAVDEANADNPFVAVATQSGLLAALEGLARDGEAEVAVQGELMGPGIQGNREELKGFQLFVFDVQNLAAPGGYLTPEARQAFMRTLYGRGVDTHLVRHVPVLHASATLDSLGVTNIKDLLAFAEGPSMAHPVREGLVFKRVDGGFSFKAISNAFLVKEKD